MKRYSLLLALIFTSFFTKAQEYDCFDVLYEQDSVNPLKIHLTCRLALQVPSFNYDLLDSSDAVIVLWGENNASRSVLFHKDTVHVAQLNGGVKMIVTYSGYHEYPASFQDSIMKITTYYAECGLRFSNIGIDISKSPIIANAYVNLKALKTTLGFSSTKFLGEMFLSDKMKVGNSLSYSSVPVCDDFDSSRTYMIPNPVRPSWYSFPYDSNYPCCNNFYVDSISGSFQWQNIVAYDWWNFVFKSDKFRNGEFMGSVTRWISIYFNYPNHTSISETHYDKIEVFPTVTTDELTLITEATDFSIQVYDFTGKIVYVNYPNNKIDVSNFPSGEYLLRITSKNGITFKRFTKI